MDRSLVYLKGEYYGKYGSGDIILARRDDLPEIKKGHFYEIDQVLSLGDASCQNDLGIRPLGCSQAYVRNTFRVTKECVDLMRDKQKGLEVCLDKIKKTK